jgi:hypothetical protein
MTIVIDDAYRGHILERLRANIKDIKMAVEEALEGETLLDVYAVGDILEPGSFTEMSDVEILFHIDGDGGMDSYLSDQAQIDLELAGIPELESPRAIVWRGPIEEKALRI